MRLLAFLVVAVAAQAQKAFEVASVRQHPDDPHIINISSSGPRLRAEAEMLGGLVMYAYQLKNYQLAWASPKFALDDAYFDIEAKAEGDATPTKAEFQQMMQALLAERFHLKVHKEIREMPVYALLLGNGAPKFKQSAPDAVPGGRITMNGRNQVFKLGKATMAQVADAMQVYAGRPIVDQTGLRGTYDVTFEATPNFRMNNPDPADIDVRTAVADQLGLRLEPRKSMIEVVVVDYAEKPSDN
jgi:uncharacterized protein (TIGR03435 family)